MKELKFIPIYKGEYNACPHQEKMEDPEKSDIIIDLFWVEWSIILAAIGYIMYSIIR